MDKINLNILLKNELMKNRNENNLEAYIMSEISSPYEDFYNAIYVLQDNLDIINNLNLLFIGSYLTSYCHYDKNIFLQLLNKNVKRYNIEKQSIIYYLNAMHIIATKDNWKNSFDYVEYLKKSVELSSSFRFVNNKLYLSEVSNKEEALKLLKQAINNVVHIYSKEELSISNNDNVPNCAMYINEFILGTHITYVIFDELKKNLPISVICKYKLSDNRLL